MKDDLLATAQAQAYLERLKSRPAQPSLRAVLKHERALRRASAKRHREKLTGGNQNARPNP